MHCTVVKEKFSSWWAYFEDGPHGPTNFSI